VADTADASANPDASTATPAMAAETVTAVPTTPTTEPVAVDAPEQAPAQVDKEPADTPTMVMPAVVQPTPPQSSLESENQKPESGTQVPESEPKTSGADDDPKLKPEPEPTVEAETKTEVEKSGNDETNDEPEKAAHGGGSGNLRCRRVLSLSVTQVGQASSNRLIQGNLRSFLLLRATRTAALRSASRRSFRPVGVRVVSWPAW